MSAQPGFRDDRELSALRVPPHSIEAEERVLGALMQHPETLEVVGDLLEPEDFYQRRHQLIYRVIRELSQAGKPYDTLSVGDAIASAGRADEVDNGIYLVELAASAYTAVNIRAHADIVADKARLRGVIELGTEMVNAGFMPEGRSASEILAEANGRMVELQPAQSGGMRRVGETLGAWRDRFYQRMESGNRLTGLPTPWSEFNAATHGLQPATLYLVAGRPSMGKSVFGLNLALMAALRGTTVGLFSLEMSEAECADRNVACLAGVAHDWVTAPEPDAEREDKVDEALRKIARAQLFIDDTPSLTVRQFEARARRMHRKNPMGLMVVDHFHDFKIDAKLARFELGAIAQKAKDLGKEWNIPVVGLAQLNRNVTGRVEKRPTLADLRESGELEQKADVIVLLHREDYYDTAEEQTHLQGVVEAIIAKGRNIRAGQRIYLRNRFDQMRVEDWTGPLPRPKPKPKKAGGGFEYDGKAAAAGGDA